MSLYISLVYFQMEELVITHQFHYHFSLEVTNSVEVHMFTKSLKCPPNLSVLILF
jgi:hypothetical protein